MNLTPEDVLSKQQIESGLKMVIRDGVASQAMGVLTGGAFLVAFAIHLGASNLTIGLLASIGPLSQLLQLPAILLVERIRNRKSIVLVAAASARIFWLLIAMIPFLFDTRTGLVVLVVSLVLSSSLGAVSGCGWNSWMRDLIPENILGKFFSKRMRVAIGFGILISVLAAGYLDIWKKLFVEHEIYAYSILFLAGFAAGMAGLFFLASTPEPKMQVASENLNLVRLISLPFKDENFRKLIAFMCSWNFAVNLAAPFFVVYMLRRLGLSMSFVIALSILSQIFNFMFLKIWGKYTDHFSNKSVLTVCGPLFLLAILAWVFTTMPDKYFLTIPLLVIIHIVMGLASAGVSLSSSNISLKLAPKGQATVYLATNTMMNSFAAGIAPILGGLSADFFAERQIDWTLKYTTPDGEFMFSTLNLQQWDFFFVLAFIMGLYSIHRLSMIKEIGEVGRKVVSNELLTEVRGQVRILSSVEGMRQMLTFPFSMIRDLYSITTTKPGNRQNKKTVADNNPRS